MDRQRVVNNPGLNLQRAVRPELYEEQIIINAINGAELNIYPDIEELEIDIAKYENINKENILICHGLDAGIKTLFEMHNTGNMVGFPNPSYGMYNVYAKIFNYKIIHFNYNNFELNLQNIYKPNLICLPNPGNPICNFIPVNQIKTILDNIDKNTWLFIDEAYYGFGADTCKKLIQKYDNLIVGRTFSKFFGLPSIRVGYLMSNPNMIKHLSSRRHSYEVSGISKQFAQYAIKNYYIFNDYAQEVITTRDWLHTQIEEPTYGHLSNSIMISVNKIIFDKLKDKNIHVGKNNFGLHVTIGSKHTMEYFLQEYMICKME